MERTQSIDTYKVYKALVDEPRSLERISWIAGVSMITAANILDQLILEEKAAEKDRGYIILKTDTVDM